MIIDDPVAAHCGHTFCRGCLAHALELSPRCPLGRCFLESTEVVPVAEWPRGADAQIDAGVPEWEYPSECLTAVRTLAVFSVCMKLTQLLQSERYHPDVAKYQCAVDRFKSIRGDNGWARWLLTEAEMLLAEALERKPPMAIRW